MAKKRSPSNQLESRPEQLPEYGELIGIMQNETASILTDYIRQYVGIAGSANQPGSGVFLNWDRVLKTQTYQELAWYDLYAEVERDPHVTAVLTSAKMNVAGMRWDITPHLEAGEKQPSGRNKAIADFVRHALKNASMVDNDSGIVWGFPQHMYNLMGAIGMGFAVSEIVWNVTPSGVLVRNILNRPQRRFQFDAVDRSLKLRDIQNPYYGSPLPQKKFIVHRCSSQWENPFGDAIDQSLYWMWLFKRTVLKFWMLHLQVAAASVPIVKHPQNANAQLKAEALEIAKMIRNGAYGRIPDNFEVIYAEAKNASLNAESYQRFIRQCNDEMSKAVNGETLTTEANSPTGTGTFAQGKVHAETKNARDVFRAHGLEDTLNQTLIKWLVDFNFANIDGYPQFRFDLEQAENLESEARIVKALSDAGYEFDEKELSEKFNYQLTRKTPPPQLAPFAPKPVAELPEPEAESEPELEAEETDNATR